eukprot:5752897-Prymnesium_polylepis.1
MRHSHTSTGPGGTVPHAAATGPSTSQPTRSLSPATTINERAESQNEKCAARMGPPARPHHLAVPQTPHAALANSDGPLTSSCGSRSWRRHSCGPPPSLQPSTGTLAPRLASH